MTEACIFDLDGTLLYTLTAIANAGNAVLKHFGYPPEPEDAYRYYCGDGAANLVRRILEKNHDTDPSHIEEGTKINNAVLEKEASLGVHPYEGMRQVLCRLKERKIKLAVCSNKPECAVKPTISEAFGDELFDAVVGQHEPLRIKPYPDMPLECCRLLGVRPENCLYFGDTGTDMKTGKTAGMKTYGVLWGYRMEKELVENGADGLLSLPCDIPGLVGDVQ